MKPFFASVVLVLLGLQSTFPLFADTGDTRANTVHSEPTALREDRISVPAEAPSIAVTPVVTTSSGSTGSLIEYPV